MIMISLSLAMRALDTEHRGDLVVREGASR